MEAGYPSRVSVRTARALWTSAFLDLAPDDLERGVAFWAGVTGYDAAAVGDSSREFPPLQPPEGAAYLWVQRVGDPPSRVHLDLHVPDLDAAVELALGSGAELMDRRDHAVLRSPGGFVFCLVTDPAGAVPPAAGWPEHWSRVDRVRIFVADDAYLGEVAMWDALRPSASLALDPVVERGLGADARAVLEIGTSDRELETARHEALGAVVVGRSAAYTDLVDPAGIWYRVVDRSH
jgi:hypothetical protein